jgi:hypothetical protein
MELPLPNTTAVNPAPEANWGCRFASGACTGDIRVVSAAARNKCMGWFSF